MAAGCLALGMRAPLRGFRVQFLVPPLKRHCVPAAVALLWGQRWRGVHSGFCKIFWERLTCFAGGDVFLPRAGCVMGSAMERWALRAPRGPSAACRAPGDGSHLERVTRVSNLCSQGEKMAPGPGSSFPSLHGDAIRAPLPSCQGARGFQSGGSHSCGLQVLLPAPPAEGGQWAAVAATSLPSARLPRGAHQLISHSSELNSCSCDTQGPFFFLSFKSYPESSDGLWLFWSGWSITSPTTTRNRPQVPGSAPGCRGSPVPCLWVT